RSDETAQHQALAAVAHELRLPLSHIKGFVTSLRRADIEWDEETRRDFLAEIDLETDRLAQLVEELCTPRSAAERGFATGTPDGSNAPGADTVTTDAGSVIDGALHRIRGLLADRTVRRHIASCLPLVRMNANQMERVLAN